MDGEAVAVEPGAGVTPAALRAEQLDSEHSAMSEPSRPVLVRCL